jgi:hypothetical protein
VALSGLAVFLRQTDPERALKYAYRAVELTDWKALGPMRVLAMVYRARGENDLAKKTLERAMLLFPNNPALAADLRGDPDPGSAAPGTGAAAKPTAKPTAPAPSVASKPDSRPAAPTSSAPPAKSTTTVAVAPPAPKPEPVIPKPPPDAVVIPPLAVGGLTLGAAVGDLLAFDVLPSPPSTKVAETLPVTLPTPPKPVDAAPVAKAVVPSKPPSKPPAGPAETSTPVAATPPPAKNVTPTPTVATTTPPPTRVAPPPVEKPPTPVPTISVESISPLAFGGLTLGATFGDLIALERFPAPPAEATPSAPPAAPAAPPSSATATSSDSPPGKPALAPKPSKKQAPPVDLHWGTIPLSTISPAFVYGEVPPPAERRP